MILYEESLKNFKELILLANNDNVYKITNSHESSFHKSQINFSKFGNINISKDLYLKTIDSSEIELGNNFDDEYKKINLFKSEKTIKYNFLMSNVISKLLLTN